MNTSESFKIIQDIDFLNDSFGNSKITFLPVAPGLIKVVLNFAKHAQAEIHLQGAHLTRWLDNRGQSHIFTSPTAVYQRNIPIRGGNPIIFPQFGPGEICQHGFARNSIWRVSSTQLKTDATIISLELRPHDVDLSYRQQWQHDFVLAVTISLGESLLTEMTVHNPNPYPLTFTQGFHTYLTVDDINSVQISGLSGLEYMDNLRERGIFQEQRDKVVVSEFTDRRYQNIPSCIQIQDTSSGRQLQMETTHCADAFVWNPWAEAEKKLADLAENSYQQFVCVEPGNMKTPQILPPGQTFHATQTLKSIA